mmetsp:Transcript_9207/g.19849  ORF Transcript_9207/g.19849 Transcript_9207/m.19849 type:complete len:128 (-) Transcript_9207:304-687(-)
MIKVGECVLMFAFGILKPETVGTFRVPTTLFSVGMSNSSSVSRKNFMSSLVRLLVKLGSQWRSSDSSGASLRLREVLLDVRHMRKNLGLNRRRGAYLLYHGREKCLRNSRGPFNSATGGKSRVISRR